MKKTKVDNSKKRRKTTKSKVRKMWVDAPLLDHDLAKGVVIQAWISTKPYFGWVEFTEAKKK